MFELQPRGSTVHTKNTGDILAFKLNTLFNAVTVFTKYQIVGWHSRTSDRVRAQGTRDTRNKELPIKASRVLPATRYHSRRHLATCGLVDRLGREVDIITLQIQFKAAALHS